MNYKLRLHSASDSFAKYEACKAGDPIAAGDAVRFKVYQTTEGILSRIHGERGANQKGGTNGRIQS
jgi:hypothetical protein